MGTHKANDMKLLMEKWFNERPNRDTPLLAKRAGLEYNTVRRIWNGGNPDCQTAMALLNVITDNQSALSYLREYFPHAAAFQERSLQTEKVYSDAEILSPALDDKTSFVIMNLAYARLANKEMIQTKFGETGLEVAESLVERDLLQWTLEGKLVPPGEKEFFNYENKVDLIKACKHIANLSHSDKGFPIVFVGALNDDEAEKAKELTREYSKALRELYFQSKGAGNNLIALSTVFVTLLDAEI